LVKCWDIDGLSKGRYFTQCARSAIHFDTNDNTSGAIVSTDSDADVRSGGTVTGTVQ